jgi:enoyl-CoA hydratase/carnithine racemase
MWEEPMKTSTERMIARKDGPIGWMQFNNPARHNAVSLDMWKAVRKSWPNLNMTTKSGWWS